MWTRAELKNRARAAMANNYWKFFIVSLVIAITGGSQNQNAVGGGGNSVYHNYQLMAGMVALLLVFLRVFIGYVLEVGGRKFFVRAAEGDYDIGHLLYFFRQGKYLNIFITMFLRTIYLILWTLLFLIPGIIKFYAYRMVPYILADNPDIGYNRAIELSNDMTRGEKFNIFILDLSFIGWYILGALALGIGVFFVQPYYDATNAELYLTLRQEAIKQDITLADELNLSSNN